MKRQTALFIITLMAVAVGFPGTSAEAHDLVRTVIVGPDPAPIPDPLVSGQNLLDALAGIPPSPERWLLKIEPGVYELGCTSLVLRHLIDVEGSGRGVTTIQSSAEGCTGPVVVCNANIEVEIRELTILNQQSGSTPQSGIVFSNHGDGLVVSRVNIEAAGLWNVYGFLSNSGSPRLSDVLVSIPAPQGIAATGLYLAGAPIVRDLRVEISDREVEFDSYGIIVNGSLDLDRAMISMSGTSPGIGIYLISGSSARITNATIKLRGPGSGLVSGTTGEIQLRLCEISATEGAAYGIQTGTDLTVEQSIIEGTTHSIGGFFDPIVRIGASRLINPIANLGGTFTCVSSYDEDFVLLSDTCEQAL